MKKLIALLLLCILPICAQAKPREEDTHFCLVESSENAYSDIIVCLNVDTKSVWNFGNKNKFEFASASISGRGWNRQGASVPISGAMQTDVDVNGNKVYTISYTANLSQFAQHDLHGIGFYIIAGNLVIQQSQLSYIVPKEYRFLEAYSIGYSYRQDIMVNAALFGGECEISPWKCWDTKTGWEPKRVWRLAENDLPFLPLMTGGY